jgi:hypothetical protein
MITRLIVLGASTILVACGSSGGVSTGEGGAGGTPAIGTGGTVGPGGTVGSTGGAGGSTGEAGASGGSTAGAGGSAGSDVYHLHAPAQHRAQSAACNVERDAAIAPVSCGPVGAGGAGGSAGTQCTGLNAACCSEPQPGGFNIDFCSSDQCASDSDCLPADGGTASGPGAMGVCACSDGAGCGRNTCWIGQCHLDSDCGSGMYCSPTSSPSCDRSYQCHTAADECADSSDCASNNYCIYDQTAKHWKCVMNDTADGTCLF